MTSIFMRASLQRSAMATLIIFAAFSGQAFAKPAIAKDAHLAAAHELMKVTKADRNFKTVVSMMMSMQKKSLPTRGPKETKILNQIFDEVEKEMIQDTAAILDAVAKIYVKHLSVEDLKATTAFYNSTAGQHFIAKQPEIMQESMIFGRDWGRKLGVRVTRRIREKAKEKGLKL